MAEEEYIRRDKLYNNLVLLAKYEIGERQQGILGCAETVRMCQAADVAPVVHAQWIEKSALDRKVYFECSHCGAQENKHTAIKGHYCWNCGARMDKETAGNNG